MKKIKKLLLYYALTLGVIASIFRDKVNNQIVCYTDSGCFFGAYSFSYYKKVFNSLDTPILLKVLSYVK